MPKLKCVFFGTPEIALPALERLCGLENIVAVVTQPETYSDGTRANVTKTPGNPIPSPVKKFAAAKSIPVLEPERLKDNAEFFGKLKSFDADLFVVAAYGRIMPGQVLSMPRLAPVNLHFSLLPKYRGAAPVAWALINGERETGITLFKIEAELDTGRILLQKRCPVAPDDDSRSLKEKLSHLAADCLGEWLEKIHESTNKENDTKTLFHGKEQSGIPTAAPKITEKDGWIDWSRPAVEIHNRVRGLADSEPARTLLPDGKRLFILKSRLLSGAASGAGPTVAGNSADASPDQAASGGIVRIEKGAGFVIKCGAGELMLLEVQKEGKKRMPAWDFWQGAGLKIGDILKGGRLR